jgi:hypothetical protein
MKSKCILFLASLFLSLCAYQTDIISKSEDVTIDILCDGRWLNDEFDFIFSKDGTYKSHYTFGDNSGSMTGRVKLKDGATFTVLKDKAYSYNQVFLPTGLIEFTYINDPSNPHSTRYLKNADGSLILWNEKSVQKADTPITLQPGDIKCVTLGNRLTSTTDNVRVRKGPGTDFEYMQFSYKDVKSNTVKQHGSVLNGTNIRILARTVEKQKVNNWENYWYYIEYKEPAGSFLTYKNAWMYGEFIYVQSDPKRILSITDPENEASFYDVRDHDISGTVTGNPEKISFQMKNAYGNVIYSEIISDYDRKNGTFTYTVSKSKRTLYIGSNTYIFVANYKDTQTAQKQITLYFHEYAGEMAKPVIYLYPTQPNVISVTVNPPHGISQSDPLYANGWNVYAYPDGRITASDGKTYPYLFWESSNYAPPKVDTGFVVAQYNLLPFFREKLLILGLNQNEIKDFTDYWIPVLRKGPFYRIHFFDKETFDIMAPLTIAPKPDTIIRVFFDAQPIDQPMQIQEQQLIPVQRKGFTVVEWGGMRY